MNKIIFFTCLLVSILSKAQSDFDTLNKSYQKYFMDGKKDSALIISKEMNRKAIIEKGDTSYWFALSTRNIGSCFQALHVNDSAEYYYKKAILLFNNNFGKENPDYVKSISKLGGLYFYIGKYAAADSLLKEAIEIRKKYFGINNPEYAGSLSFLAILYQTIGKYVDAEPLYLEALNIYQKSSGKINIDYAKCLSNLAILYQKMGNYDSSESLFKETLEIYKEISGKENMDYAKTLNNLAILYIFMGNYSAAEPLFKEAIEIRMNSVGKDHPDYATSLSNLAGLYVYMGNYIAAEPLFKKSLAIFKQLKLDEHPDYANNLNNLAALYFSIGDYKAAEPLYFEALHIYEKSFGKDHPDYANNLGNLADLYLATKNYVKAEPFYKEAIEIYSKVVGKRHPDYAKSIGNLASLYLVMGKDSFAIASYKEAIEIYNKTLGKENREYPWNLYNLAILYLNMGQYKLAEPLLNEAILLIEHQFGNNHPDYLTFSNGLAKLYSKTNRLNAAYDIYKINLNKKTKSITDNFEWLSDVQKENYWKREESFFDNLNEFASECHSVVPNSTQLSYNAALFSKSKLLETTITKENYFNDVSDLRVQVKKIRSRLNKLESDGSIDYEIIKRLSFQADSLDKLLTLSWPAYAEQKKNLQITWNQVQSNLTNNEVAIEFIRNRINKDSIYKYYALLIRKEFESPIIVQLCNEKQLSAIRPSSGFSSYYPLVWQPLEEYLKGIKTIYYSTIGELNDIPFHSLYSLKGKGDIIKPVTVPERGSTLLEITESEINAEFLMDKYTLHQLTSTRYLAMGIKDKAEERIQNSIIIAGGINYDYLPNNITLEKVNKPNIKTDLSNDKFRYLPGTKNEVEKISSTIRLNNWKITLLMQNEATEENITRITEMESKCVLHIATHGYSTPELDVMDTNIVKSSFRYNFRYSINPMIRSGLILTGGNWAWTGNDTLIKMGKENGILTALEVSQLNLKRTKLVVLSACETGLGKIESSEGTFGLKRGFKLAGVEQLIVSLWSVPDFETMELMTLFYQDLTLTQKPIVSFQKAQMAMRRKYPTRPDLWAAFVLVR